jgi:hypothetical protein
MKAWALFLGLKWPGREADHSPPSGAEVKECVELYLYSPNYLDNPLKKLVFPWVNIATAVCCYRGYRTVSCFENKECINMNMGL